MAAQNGGTVASVATRRVRSVHDDEFTSSCRANGPKDAAGVLPRRRDILTDRRTFSGSSTSKPGDVSLRQREEKHENYVKPGSGGNDRRRGFGNGETDAPRMADLKFQNFLDNVPRGDI